MYKTHRWGKIAELEVERRAAEKGFVVSRPTTETRYDIVLDINGKLIRGQVKYASHNINGAVRIDLRTQCRNNGYIKKYNDGEIDVVLAYIPDVDKVVWLDSKVFVGVTAVSLRIKSTKNGQRSGIRFVEDFVW